MSTQKFSSMVIKLTGFILLLISLKLVLMILGSFSTVSYLKNLNWKGIVATLLPICSLILYMLICLFAIFKGDDIARKLVPEESVIDMNGIGIDVLVRTAMICLGIVFLTTGLSKLGQNMSTMFLVNAEEITIAKGQWFFLWSSIIGAGIQFGCGLVLVVMAKFSGNKTRDNSIANQT